MSSFDPNVKNPNGRACSYSVDFEIPVLNPTGELHAGHQWPIPVTDGMLNISREPNPDRAISVGSVGPDRAISVGSPNEIISDPKISFNKPLILTNAGLTLGLALTHGLSVQAYGVDPASTIAKNELVLMGILFSMMVYQIAEPAIKRYVDMNDIMQRLVGNLSVAAVGIAAAKIIGLSLPGLIGAANPDNFVIYSATYCLGQAIFNIFSSNNIR